MFCINCFAKDTRVVNSRALKNRSQIWRRRYCKECSKTFTTYEKPSLGENKLIVRTGNTNPEAFNIGKLIISLSKTFTHSPRDAEYSTLWLAQTIQDTLSTQRENITPEDIAATAHLALKHFDELAAVQYAAQHQLITSVRRRGRPSLT